MEQRGLVGASSRKGFTLIELMVVVAVMAVLMSLAAPAMTSMLDAAKMSSLSNQLLSSLQFTRSEAIKRSGRVVMCKSTTGSSCALDGGWEQGWIVFHDANNNAAVDAGEEILKYESGTGSNLSLTGNTPVARYVSYTAVGVAKMQSGAFQAGTFTLCLKSSPGTEARHIIVNKTGRAHVEKTTVTRCQV